MMLYPTESRTVANSIHNMEWYYVNIGIDISDTIFCINHNNGKNKINIVCNLRTLQGKVA